jgi:hypothetical protein
MNAFPFLVLKQFYFILDTIIWPKLLNIKECHCNQLNTKSYPTVLFQGEISGLISVDNI